jgi:hypothetical protein
VRDRTWIWYGNRWSTRVPAQYVPGFFEARAGSILRRMNSMPVKATCIDENRTIHVVIALDREDLNRLMAGGCLNFNVGTALSSNSQIQIAFGEADDSGRTGKNFRT